VGLIHDALPVGPIIDRMVAEAASALSVTRRGGGARLAV
jgi:hypothetical protein